MILKSFGPRLKSLRQSKNLNQNELSQFLNISRQCYSHYEAGRRLPPVDILADLTILLEYDFFSMFLEASASKFAYSNFQFGSNIIHESEDLTCQKIQKISLLEFSSRRQGSGQATPSLKSPDSQVPPVPPTVI
ncbi:MAG: helix-turn-helix transcriptional regulator [Lachnospiraceae bacterium]|nr:helix-turn-helix transcriptional regulator [Lachnospiraceae bacterium]